MEFAPWGRLAVAVGMAISAQAGAAAVLYQQSFDTDTTSLAETISTYGFTNDGVSEAVVQSGQALFTPPGGQSSLNFGTFAGDLVVSFDATIQGGPGAINVGLRVGDNNYIFHPTFPTGAFRIDGPGGGGNEDMGFTPSASFSQVRVAIDSVSQMTSIRIVNGSNVFERSFFDANYAAGSSVFGLSVGGRGVGLFDNLLVTSAVPEPETYALLACGLGLMAAARRRRG